MWRKAGLQPWLHDSGGAPSEGRILAIGKFPNSKTNNGFSNEALGSRVINFIKAVVNATKNTARFYKIRFTLRTHLWKDWTDGGSF